MRLAFVTGNPGKLQEARDLLAPLVEIESDPNGYPELQADTLKEVAEAGLVAVAERRDPPYFLEDAGLFIDALSSFPGVYSAYVYRTLGLPGILRLLKETPESERTARFQAVIGYRDADGQDHFFDGTVEGWIRHRESGEHGFGFDPIFTPRERSSTPDGASFADLAPEEKSRLSHRGQALAKLKTHLEQSLRGTRSTGSGPALG